jgi:hypothetical protein
MDHAESTKDHNLDLLMLQDETEALPHTGEQTSSFHSGQRQQQNAKNILGQPSVTKDNLSSEPKRLDHNAIDMLPSYRPFEVLEGTKCELSKAQLPDQNSNTSLVTDPAKSSTSRRQEGRLSPDDSISSYPPSLEASKEFEDVQWKVQDLISGSNSHDGERTIRIKDEAVS